MAPVIRARVDVPVEIDFRRRRFRRILHSTVFQLRSNEPLAAERLFDTIDAMPMRKDEMRR